MYLVQWFVIMPCLCGDVTNRYVVTIACNIERHVMSWQGRSSPACCPGRNDSGGWWCCQTVGPLSSLLCPVLCLSGCYLFLASVKMLRCCYDVLRENCYILSRTGMFSSLEWKYNSQSTLDIFFPLFYIKYIYHLLRDVLLHKTLLCSLFSSFSQSSCYVFYSLTFS